MDCLSASVSLLQTGQSLVVWQRLAAAVRVSRGLVADHLRACAYETRACCLASAKMSLVRENRDLQKQIEFGV